MEVFTKVMKLDSTDIVNQKVQPDKQNQNFSAAEYRVDCAKPQYTACAILSVSLLFTIQMDINNIFIKKHYGFHL